MKPILAWKSNKYYIFLCVWARERVCVRVCVWVGRRFGVCECMRTCSLTQHAKRIHRNIFSSVACLVPPCFWILSYKRQIFGKKLLNIKCVLIFSTFSWNVSFSKKYCARYCHKCENVFMQSTVYSCRILMKQEFSCQSSGKS